MNDSIKPIVFPLPDSLAARILLVLHEFRKVVPSDVGCARDKAKFAAALADLRERGWQVHQDAVSAFMGLTRGAYWEINPNTSTITAPSKGVDVLDVLRTPAGQAFLKAVRERVR